MTASASKAIRTERLYAGMYLVHTPADTYRIHKIEGYGTRRWWLVTTEGRFQPEDSWDERTLTGAIESIAAVEAN